MASLESAAVCGVGRRFVAGVSPARCVCEVPVYLVSSVSRVSPCVSVNVNMTVDTRDNRCYDTVTARSEYTHLVYTT